MTITAYKSSDPSIVAAWEEWLAARTAIPAQWQAFVDEVAPGYSFLAYSRGGMVGLKPADDGKVPEHWRVEHWRTTDVLLPDRRSKVGKALAKRLDEMPQIPSCALPGMPTEVWEHDGTSGGMRIRGFGAFAYDGAVYVSWECVVEDNPKAEILGDKLDRSKWQPLKLSEYYAAQEAMEGDQTEVPA